MKRIPLGSLSVYALLVAVFVFLLYFLYGEVSSDEAEISAWHVVMDALFFALPVLFWKKKVIVFPWVLLVVLYLLSIVWYSRTYATIMPLSSYLMFYNLDGLGASILHSIHPSDVKFLFPPLLFFICYAILGRRGWPVSLCGRRLKQGIAWGMFLWGSAGTSLPYWPNNRPFYQQPLYLFGIVNTSAIKQ